MIYYNFNNGVGIYEKIFLVLTLLLLNATVVFAQDVYAFTDISTGKEYYVTTESIKQMTADKARGEGRIPDDGFLTVVKTVKNGKLAGIGLMSFRPYMMRTSKGGAMVWHYTYEDEPEKFELVSSSPLAYAVFNVCVKYNNVAKELARIYTAFYPLR